MYFINEEHKGNFETLIRIYPVYKQTDPEYLSNLYLASFPEIYKFINLGKLEENDNGGTPLKQFLEWNEEENEMIISHSGLTSGAKGMVRIGISLFNGTPVRLGTVLRQISTEDWQKVVIEAIRIRIGLKELY